MSTPETPRHLLIRALEADDLANIETIIRDHPDLLKTPKGRPALTKARTVATAGRLLNLGADIHHVSDWWVSGMYTRTVDAHVGRFLVDRGATLTVHAAAGLGLVDQLAGFLDADPSLIDAKGGDGCTPLHFARDIAIAALLLDRGARIDALDEDHESTPAQWLIGDVPEVVRFLLQRGARPDIFTAAALGDRELAEQLIASNPACVSQRIGRMPDFPPLGHKSRGGTIYQWTLAFNSYPHQIALAKGHQGLFDFLCENSDTPTRLLVSCVLARRPEAEAIVAENPGLVASLPSADHELVARYCWETNTNIEAVRLMLDVGFPLAHPERSHGYTPLHNAAWSGSGDLVDMLIERGHPVDIVDPTYHATPLGFAIYDCTVEKRHPEGDFGRVIKSLLDAGSPWNPLDYPTGDARIDDVFKSRMPDRIEGAALLGDESAVDRLLQADSRPEQLAKALAGAAKGGHVALSRRLINAGAPVNQSIGEHQITPLMYAALSNSADAAALLIEHGADIAATNAVGSTALHFAIRNGANLDIIDLLLRSGAATQIELTNKWGYTPLRIAEEEGRQDVLELLGSTKRP